MKLSIAAYSFVEPLKRGAIDVFGYLEACKYRYRLGAADIWNGLIGSDSSVGLDPARLDLVKEAMAERELVLANYHADHCHAWEDDAAKREQFAALAMRHIDAAERLGAKTVRIDTGGPEPTWTNEQFDFIVKRFAGYAKRAADNGYRIGPEVHWGAELQAENMLKLAKAIDHPGFGLLVHMGRATMNGKPAPDEADRLLAPYACHTHFDQSTIETRLSSAISILHGANYDGYFGIEHPATKNTMRTLETLVARMRNA